MNKKHSIAAILLAASATFAFDTWIGAEGTVQVETGLGNATETYGYWFSYADDNDGGLSKVDWNGLQGSESSAEALDNVIAACGGVCGTAILNKGSLTYPPFVGIGFNVVGETSAADKTAVPGDASAWGGLCVTYTSEAPMALELGLGDKVDATIGFANPAASLPKATAGTKKVLTWADFKQPSWYNGATKMDGPTASSQLVAVKFKIQAAAGSYAFNICSVGPSDGTCPADCGTPDPHSIKSVRGASSVKAVLSGRTLGFTGVKSDATAEVFNLHGQVVAKGDASSAMNLASLDAGIYMVRVSGKSVNFSNKIVLK